MIRKKRGIITLPQRHRLKHLGLAASVLASTAIVIGCTPTVNVNLNMSPIYAKLDVNVRIQLDEDVKALALKNPNLF